MAEPVEQKCGHNGIDWDGKGNCIECARANVLSESEEKEPTIDWLIDQLISQSSPLVRFNKERLKKAIRLKERESKIAGAEGFRDQLSLAYYYDEEFIVGMNAELRAYLRFINKGDK